MNALQHLVGPQVAANWKILALVLGASLLMWLVRRVRWSRQSTAVNTVATEIGFVPLSRLPEELTSFKLPLTSGKPRNILGGTVNGNEVVLFDTEFAHPRRGPSLQTIVAFKLSGSKLPDFSLQPKGVLGRGLSVFGKGIDFGDSSAFCRDYSLISPNESAARACFTAEFRNFFEGLERFDSNKNWHLQKHGAWLIIFRKGEGVEPERLQTFLEGTGEIVRNLETTADHTV